MRGWVEGGVSWGKNKTYGIKGWGEENRAKEIR